MDYWENIRNRIFAGHDLDIYLDDDNKPITEEEFSNEVIKYAYKEMVHDGDKGVGFLSNYALLIGRGVQYLGPQRTLQIAIEAVNRAKYFAHRRN